MLSEVSLLSATSYLSELVEYWALCLSSSDVEYLLGRGASEAQIEGMRLGTALKLPHPSGDSEEVRRFMRWAGGGKRLMGQISFPLHNQMSEVTGVLVKSAGAKDYMKYTRSGTAVSSFFFGVPMAMEALWRTRTVWIVEGVFDWFPLQRLFPNTLACTFDTLGWKQIDFVRRYVDTVVLALDMDASGRDGAELAQERLRGVEVLTARYPYKDPGDFWQKRGEFAFQQHFLEESQRLGLT
jgi:DNA primase